MWPEERFKTTTNMCWSSTYCAFILQKSTYCVKMSRVPTCVLVVWWHLRHRELIPNIRSRSGKETVTLYTSWCVFTSSSTWTIWPAALNGVGSDFLVNRYLMSLNCFSFLCFEKSSFVFLLIVSFKSLIPIVNIWSCSFL